VFFSQNFLRGINYWPANKAMYWWKDFDLGEVERDLIKLRSYKIDLLRFFLTWEDFQPRPDNISFKQVDQLKRLADLAYDLGMYLMPTFFCGHMSGVNWIPEWMLGPRLTQQRFPVFCNGSLKYAEIRNFYKEEELITAQLLQIRIIAGALADHPAILAYDLGNESSNCVIPPDRSFARQWLEKMSGELKMASPANLITFGMHAEDLEENRNLWPQDAAQFCDFLSMHGYPFYLAWVDKFDYWVLPFLGIITQWLGEKPVLFQEFGAPTRSKFPPADNLDSQLKYACPLWSEGETADYYQHALLQLDQAGMLGAMAWCFSDYPPNLWNQAPLKDNPHERHFGLFRHDGSAKLSAQVWKEYDRPNLKEKTGDQNIQLGWEWLNNLKPDQFYNCPRQNLIELYSRYIKSGYTPASGSIPRV